MNGTRKMFYVVAAFDSLMQAGDLSNPLKVHLR